MYNNKKKNKKANTVISSSVVREGNVVKGCMIVKIQKDNTEIKTPDIKQKA